MHAADSTRWDSRLRRWFICREIIAFAAVVAVALAAPPHQDYSQAVVVKETPLDNIGIDGYQFGYELSSGQSHQESAQLVNAGQENESFVVRGSFSYVDPETNVRYTVNYVADENGFHPEARRPLRPRGRRPRGTPSSGLQPDGRREGDAAGQHRHRRIPVRLRALQRPDPSGIRPPGEPRPGEREPRRPR
ncbi:flexible cuticle protein 12-like isoform X1 [Temnothorax americanus]|uniref:flexible cuticle protein 12-like isoform X1 n=1 Tax=Temnothorax americanus TaxID=1964332 RepID=UPI0040696F07